MAANGAAALHGQSGASVVTFSTSSSQSSMTKRVGTRQTGRGGSGNIRQEFRPSAGGLEEDKVTSPSGREVKTRSRSQISTGAGGAGNVEATSQQRLEEARAFLQKEKAVLAQHQQEMRRHEKQRVGRGGAGNLRRKKDTTVPKEFGFPGAQVGSNLFKTMSRSSRSSSEWSGRSVIDIRRVDRDSDSDMWSIAESTMSRASTAGIIISKFGGPLSFLGKRQRPVANTDADRPPPAAVTGVCYSDAAPNQTPNPKSGFDVDVTPTSPYSPAPPPPPPPPPTRTPNEVAPFEEPSEPSPLAAAVLHAHAHAAAASPHPQSSRPLLKRLFGGGGGARSADEDEYPTPPKSATSATFSLFYPYTNDDAASFVSNQSRRAPVPAPVPVPDPSRSASPIFELYQRQPADTLRPTLRPAFPLSPIPSSATAALRMISRSTYDRDRYSDRTGNYSSGSSFYSEQYQYSPASTSTESRNDYSARKATFPHFNAPSHRASTGGQYATSHSPSTFSVVTTHSESSVPQLESFTPTFGIKKLPSLPAASLRSFDEFSLPSPPSTPLPGSVYSEDGYDSDGMTIADPHTRRPQLDF